MQTTIEISYLLSVALYILIFIGLVVIYRIFRNPINHFVWGLSPIRKNRRLNRVEERLDEIEEGWFELRMQNKRLSKKCKRQIKKHLKKSNRKKLPKKRTR